MMIDIQNSADYRGLPLHNVGIKDYTLQMTINGEHTLATVEFAVSLDAEHKGIHMSRLCQLLDSYNVLNNKSITELLSLALKILETDSASIAIDTIYFRRKLAPVTNLSGVMGYKIYVSATASQAGTTIKHCINIPIAAVCPCSKAISNFGAHNQRGNVCVSLVDVDVFDYDTIIDIVEKQAASCELYSVLKREDEKAVTESAYQNAKFVEDITRDAIIGIRSQYGSKLRSIECINYESIHNHNAFAFYGNGES